MIDFGRLILVGRHETLPEEKRVVLARLTPMLLRACEALRERWPDRLDAWTRWNVAAWHVEGTALTRIDLLTFDGLGVRPMPHLVECWTYLATLHHVDPLPVPNDPPLLHRSSQVLDEREPVRDANGKPVLLPVAEWRTRVERIRLLEDALDREGMLDTPQAQTVRGLESLLRWKGLRVEAHTGGWRLSQIQDRDMATLGVEGDCLDRALPKRLDIKGPRGLSIAESSTPSPKKGREPMEVH